MSKPCPACNSPPADKKRVKKTNQPPTIILQKGENMGRMSSYTHSQEELDHYANQNNPNSDAYQHEMDNHADQLNPNNDEYSGND
jgi:hypothetical protein